MDLTDLKIIECLKNNARANASSIGSEINMSVSAVLDRIKKLEASGIIRQYTLILDKEKAGIDITAFISVCMEHPKYIEPFLDLVKNHPNVVECHYITGDADFLLKVCTESGKGLEKIVNEIKATGGISRTKTLVVLSTNKENYSPDLTPEALGITQ